LNEVISALCHRCLGLRNAQNQVHQKRNHNLIGKHINLIRIAYQLILDNEEISFFPISFDKPPHPLNASDPRRLSTLPVQPENSARQVVSSAQPFKIHSPSTRNLFHFSGHS
jgi:hypothetical protein